MLQDIMDINGQKFLMLMLSVFSVKPEYSTGKLQNPSGKTYWRKEELKNLMTFILDSEGRSLQLMRFLKGADSDNQLTGWLVSSQFVY